MNYVKIRTPEGWMFVPVGQFVAKSAADADYPEAAHLDSMADVKLHQKTSADAMADANLHQKNAPEIANLMNALSFMFGIAPARANRDGGMFKDNNVPDDYYYNPMDIHRDMVKQPVHADPADPADPAELLDMLMGKNRPAQVRKNPIPWGTNTESAEAMEFLKILGLIPDEDDSSVRFKANLLTGNIGETVCCEITPCEDNLFIYVYSLRNKNWRMSCIGQIVTTMDELNKKFGDYIPSSFYAIIREGYVEVDMNAVNKRRNVIPGFHMKSNDQADETLARILGEFHNAAKLDQFASPDDMPIEYSARWANAYQIYQNGLENLMLDVAKALDA